MSRPPASAANAPETFSPSSSGWKGFAGVLIVGAVFAAYHNSLGGPFVFDDFPTIVENPTIREWRTALFPPHESGLTVNGRPVVNLSLALNYACGGIDPRGYHLVNVAIHGLAAWVLFGVVRRTLQRTPLRDQALFLATAVAVIWAVHPLQTSAVTYVVQRSESLAGLFYFLTLYAFARSVASNPIDYSSLEAHAEKAEKAGRVGKAGARWRGVAIGACALGMATKEVMVSAPLLVLLYDRTFIAESFSAVWRARWRFYAALGTTWLLLGWLMLGTGARGGTAGFGLGVTGWAYALKQSEAIVHYLKLALWPDPLVFDYGGMVLVENLADVWPQMLLLGILAVGAGFGLWRGSRAAKREWLGFGFLGVWFFAILAPTSSVVPLADTMFEHRMYLPLVAIVVLVVLAIHRVLGRISGVLFGILAVGLGGLTVQRNSDYASELTLWRDTVAKRPDNVRAHYTLGSVLFAAGQVDAAIAEYEAALKLNPNSAPAHNNLGNALVQTGRVAQALPHYEAALRVVPRSTDTHNNLANALVRLGRIREARTHYETALELQPDFADAHNNLGNVLAQSGELTNAAQHYEAALRLRPDLADAQANLGNVLAQSGRLTEALPHYEAALRLRPNFLDAHYNFATALTELRRWPEAIVHYQAVLRLRPDHEAARANLARAQALNDVHGR